MVPALFTSPDAVNWFELLKSMIKVPPLGTVKSVSLVAEPGVITTGEAACVVADPIGTVTAQ